MALPCEVENYVLRERNILPCKQERMNYFMKKNCFVSSLQMTTKRNVDAVCRTHCTRQFYLLSATISDETDGTLTIGRSMTRSYDFQASTVQTDRICGVYWERMSLILRISVPIWSGYRVLVLSEFLRMLPILHSGIFYTFWIKLTILLHWNI